MEFHLGPGPGSGASIRLLKDLQSPDIRIYGMDVEHSFRLNGHEAYSTGDIRVVQATVSSDGVGELVSDGDFHLSPQSTVTNNVIVRAGDDVFAHGSLNADTIDFAGDLTVTGEIDRVGG